MRRNLIHVTKVALLSSSPFSATLKACLSLGKVSHGREVRISFYTFFRRAVISGRSLKGRNRTSKDYTLSFLSSLLQHVVHFPPLCANTFCSVNIHMTWALWHAAAGPHLRLLFLYWLLEFEERRVSTGRRVVHRAAIGGDQWHAGVLGVGFGISEGVCGAVT